MTQQFPPPGWQPSQWAPPPPPPSKPSFWRSKKGAAVLLGGGLLAAVVVAGNSGSDASRTPSGAPRVVAPATAGGGLTQETWASPGGGAPYTVESASLPASGSFGDGTYEVNVDIQPGKYKTSGGDGCYWERQKDDQNNFDSIIANDYSKGPMTVTIKPSDAYFQTNGCTWTRVD